MQFRSIMGINICTTCIVEIYRQLYTYMDPWVHVASHTSQLRGTHIGWARHWREEGMDIPSMLACRRDHHRLRIHNTWHSRQDGQNIWSCHLHISIRVTLPSFSRLVLGYLVRYIICEVSIKTTGRNTYISSKQNLIQYHISLNRKYC